LKNLTHFLSFLAQFFLELEMFETNVIENFKMYIDCSITFSLRKSWLLFR